MQTLTTFEKATITVNTGYNTESQTNTTVDKTWAELTSSERQEIASTWIGNNVYCNVNGAMELLSQSIDHCEYDDYLSLAESRDYIEPVTYYLENELSEEEIEELLIDRDLDEEVEEELTLTEKIKMIINDFDQYDFFEQYADSNGIEPDYDQAYEFWAVSDHFSRLLPDNCSDLLGFTVWARFCTGQAICLDYQVQVAAFKALSNCHYDHY